MLNACDRLIHSILHGFEGAYRCKIPNPSSLQVSAAGRMYNNNDFDTPWGSQKIGLGVEEFVQMNNSSLHLV